MVHGRLCYCINPRCQKRENIFHVRQTKCANCGTPLVIEPHKLLLEKPLYGYLEPDTNSEVFVVDSFDFDGPAYPKILKILKTDAITKAKELFQREGNILSQLRGHAVPRVPPQPYFQVTVKHPHTDNLTDPLHCLVMEHIEGQSLEEVIEATGKIDVDQAIDWLRQLAQLLKTVHRNQIIHRDIKPANIIVRQNPKFPYGELVLIDFGAARRSTISYIDELASERSMTKIISPGYTAPEQCQGRYTFQSDLFAVGRTIQHLLTNIYPDDQTYNKLNWRELIPLEPLRILLLDLTKTNPKKRTASAQALLDDIEKLLHNLDRHPLLAWFSTKRKPWVKSLAIACSLTLVFPIGLKMGVRLLPSANISQAAYKAYQLGNYRSALLSYFLLQQTHLDQASGYYGAGKVHQRLNNFDRAITNFKRAIKLDAYHSPITCRAEADLGLLYFNQDDLSLAVKHLSTAATCIENPETQLTIYRHLAISHYELLQLEQAQIYLTKSLDIAPEHPFNVCLQQLFNTQQKAIRTKWISGICS